MLVQCPNCKTTYKVAEEVVKGAAAPAFRCSRCRHTFELGVDERQLAPVESRDETAAQAEPGREQELSFSFPAKDAAGPGAKAPSASTDSTPRSGESAGELLMHDQWSLTGTETKDDAPFTVPQATPSAAAQPTPKASQDFADESTSTTSARGFDGDDSNYKILPMLSYVDHQASISPYLTLFGLLVIGFSLIAVISHAHPRAAEGLVKNIPLIGASVLKNNYLRDGILLQSLRGGYQSIQGNREVFVITGVVINQNPVVIREIRLSGRVYNEVGKELELQTIWVGNTLSEKIIRGMTPEDIPHLQSLKPLKSFEMPPGDSIPFAIVFLRATKSAKEFSCEVALAEGET